MDLADHVLVDRRERAVEDATGLVRETARRTLGCVTPPVRGPDSLFSIDTANLSLANFKDGQHPHVDVDLGAVEFDLRWRRVSNVASAGLRAFWLRLPAV